VSTEAVRSELGAIRPWRAAESVAITRPAQAQGLGIWRLVSINAYWFGRGAHWRAILISLLFAGATLVAGKDAVLLQGRVMTAGGILALLMPIVGGWLSDHTASRWGRRRPWMVAGTAVNVVGLGLLAVAGTPALLFLAFMLVQASNNLAEGAYAGVIPDIIPDERRGRASSLLGAMEQLGSVVGLGAVLGVYALLGQTRTALIISYALLAIMLVAGLIVAVRAIDEPPLSKARSGRTPANPAAVLSAIALLLSLACVFALLAAPLGKAMIPVVCVAVTAAVSALVVGRRLPQLHSLLSPFKDNDFFWVFTTRALVTLGLVITVGVMPYYFAAVVGLRNPTMVSAAFGLTVVLAAVASALWSGEQSDREGRRKRFVYLSSGLQAAVAVVLLLGLTRSLPLIFGLGAIYGLGFGAYTAVDWALACDVLPDRKGGAGKDMGLWHASLTVPTVIGPALLALLLYYLEQPGHWILGIPTGGHAGFRVGFGIAALAYVLGTAMVARIRRAR
jgi:MFS family permease